MARKKIMPKVIDPEDTPDEEEEHGLQEDEDTKDLSLESLLSGDDESLAEQEEKIIYGDPTKPEPQGVIEVDPPEEVLIADQPRLVAALAFGPVLEKDKLSITSAPPKELDWQKLKANDLVRLSVSGTVVGVYSQARPPFILIRTAYGTKTFYPTHEGVKVIAE